MLSHAVVTPLSAVIVGFAFDTPLFWFSCTLGQVHHIDVYSCMHCVAYAPLCSSRPLGLSLSDRFDIIYTPHRFSLQLRSRPLAFPGSPVRCCSFIAVRCSPAPPVLVGRRCRSSITLAFKVSSVTGLSTVLAGWRPAVLLSAFLAPASVPLALGNCLSPSSIGLACCRPRQQ